MDKRIAEKYDNGKWRVIDFVEIVEGDRFRLFESTGEAVIDKKGKREWVAASKVFNNFGDSVVNVY